MFTKRHEQELAEIKALTYEIGQRFEDLLKELERIKEVQDQLAARDQQAPAGKRSTGPAEAQVTDGDTPESEAAGTKRARRRQPSAPVAVAAGAKAGKRRGKAGPEGGAARKRGGGGGRKKRQSSEPAPSSGSDEE